jgi:hypothetical protein
MGFVLPRLDINFTRPRHGSKQKISWVAFVGVQRLVGLCEAGRCQGLGKQRATTPLRRTCASRQF